MILEEEISIDLNKAIKKGDFETFQSLVSKNSVDASSKLFGKRESSCWPLIQRTLADSSSNSFNNKNYVGRLKIANFLIKNGANLNDTAPYMCSVLTSFLDAHYWLRVSKAKYDVYLHTLIFALEIVRQDSLNVNLLEKSSCGILDSAIRIYEFHKREGNDELLKIAEQIIKELFENGAVTEEKKDMDTRLKPIINEITKHNKK